MNVFVVRTRLQALIVQKIIENQKPSQRYICVFSYQTARNEDSEHVYALYRKLKKKAIFSLSVVGMEGILNNTAKYLFCNFLAFLTGGTVYFAGINSYPLVLAARFLPFVKMNTLDDGSANFLNWSAYYNDQPLQGVGIKRKLSRYLFPAGCAKWMRSRTQRHYTIFPNRPNIVGRDRLVALEWNWEELLDCRDVRQLPASPRIVVLGTPHQDYVNSSVTLKQATDLLETSDLYIMHPREKWWSECHKMVRLHSPAEAVLINMSARDPLIVCHFNSTVAHALDGMRNLKFIDMTEETVSQVVDSA